MECRRGRKFAAEFPGGSVRLIIVAEWKGCAGCSVRIEFARVTTVCSYTRRVDGERRGRGRRTRNLLAEICPNLVYQSPGNIRQAATELPACQSNEITLTRPSSDARDYICSDGNTIRKSVVLSLLRPPRFGSIWPKPWQVKWKKKKTKRKFIVVRYEIIVILNCYSKDRSIRDSVVEKEAISVDKRESSLLWTFDQSIFSTLQSLQRRWKYKLSSWQCKKTFSGNCAMFVVQKLLFKNVRSIQRVVKNFNAFVEKYR